MFFYGDNSDIDRKKIMVRFVNRKYAKKLLINRKGPAFILNSSPNHDIFIQNLTLSWVILRKDIQKLVLHISTPEMGIYHLNNL